MGWARVSSPRSHSTSNHSWLISVLVIQGHTSAVSSVARSSNDHLVVSGSQSGTILMHTVSSSAAQQMVNLTKDQPTKQVSRCMATYFLPWLSAVCCLWAGCEQTSLLPHGEDTPWLSVWRWSCVSMERRVSKIAGQVRSVSCKLVHTHSFSLRLYTISMI